MPIEIKMPALSPTMEEGKLAKWLVKEGDTVSSGDIMAEIETDKATMEFEAVDEGVIGKISVAEGTEGVKVGTVIAVLVEEGEDASAIEAPKAEAPEAAAKEEAPKAEAKAETKPAPAAAPKAAASGDRVVATPLAKRIADAKGVDLSGVAGSGPNGRIVKADVEAAQGGTAKKAAPAPAAPAPAAAPAAAATSSVEMADETRALLDARVPHTVEKLSGMRKTIARRLTQSMQEAPHIYLTVDVQLDKLMALRSQINATLEKQGVKVSVNDMLVKALGAALIAVPECNVTFAGNELIKYERADVSVAVSIPGGLITPIVQGANEKSFSAIAKASKDLATRAKEGKLKPEEYQGGTASISNMGMMGIKQFTAVINPPQSTILAIGAGDKRPWVMPDGSLGVATIMTATGSFDHRAIDGADGARLMAAFREFVENPLSMIA
ncbi:pyruvate dehydrogenase complex dihydrolipoamide acetyltransferase [Novosphingobium resinovorum]|uniref:Acetyltransferase component of pyruvate dehydrogenase complex n=1 Tax=Novosphingobium resinovorum TaxID=158500 RepID=A0A031K8S1_9SPHN|nr:MULTISPECIES: pyruvate dehydrogenase complex dihydrolipoamide acetyltransferase [Sphingomonadaceae]EJU09872.1 pyruvate dehydrogenase E2 component (dihydrolipoamide acetyltransferase) [Sphingomonas sp. LH128]EZP85017.1 Pyruvate dehydrogenase E2 component (Dihydrolipoamide acetyltransferase) [Novosphingobium resinovorum]MBF7011384.1 pyruvate dehydrogenase complex dihydrolipoamide acetyltransferase [Novosphingobium sp. HR1a]WJM29365.1 pyruvate dehydrogenase complex dihydrolipoamide acetyltransf